MRSPVVKFTTERHITSGLSPQSSQVVPEMVVTPGNGSPSSNIKPMCLKRSHSSEEIT